MHTQANTYILYCKFECKLEGGLYAKYYNDLPAPVRKQLNLLKRWEDAQASLLGKQLLKYGLVKYLDKDENILEKLNKDRHGRPYLENERGYDFNITHSENMIMCAISEKGKIGLDVERVRPVTIDHFVRQFTGQELVNIHRADEPYHEFFAYWTKKESVLKAEGIGMGIPLNQINVDRKLKMATVGEQQWYLKAIDIDQKFRACLASDFRLSDDDIHIEGVSLDKKMEKVA